MGEPLKQDMKSDRPQPANPTYGVQAEALAGDRSEVAQNLQADVTFFGARVARFREKFNKSYSASTSIARRGQRRTVKRIARAEKCQKSC